MKITDEKLDQMLHNEENPAFDHTFEFKGKKEKINIINKKTFIRVLAASLVFVMLAAAVFVVLHPKDNGLPTVPVDTAKLGGSDSDPSTECDPEGGEPDQYPPERPDTQGIEPIDPVNGITVYTLTSSFCQNNGRNNAGYVNRCVAGIDGAKINRITDARYINITSADLDSEHAGHGCLIYDTVEDEFICGTCILNEKADRILQNGGERIIIDNVSTPDTLLFAVWNDENNKIVRRYLYDVKTDVLTEIPAPSDNDFDTLAANEDFRYVVSHDYRKTDADLDDVYLIDTLAKTAVNISGAYPTFMLSRFTSDGRFVLNALKYYGSTENFDSELCKFIVYDTKSGMTTECMGKVLRYNGGMLLTRDGEQVHHLYDPANGREVEITENTYYWDNINGDLYRGNAYNGKTYLTDETVAAICVSEDGENVYTYSSGAGYIVKRSLDGVELQIPLDSAFTSETEKMAETMDFTFMLREKNGVIVLLYTTTEKPVIDPDYPEQPQIKSNHDAVFDVLKNDKVSSIKEVVTALKEKYPDNDFGFTVSEGDGFTVLYIDARDGTKRAFAEDYRDNTFSAYYEGKDRAYIRLLSYAPGKYERRKLASAEAETKAFIAENKISTGQADLDYAIFYDNGEFSEEKVKDYSFINTSNISFFYAFCGSHGIGVGDKTKLNAFLSEFASCGRQRVELLSSYDITLFGYIKTSTNLSFQAFKHKNGGYYIRVNYEDYKVPEYVFADLVSLAASAFAESGFRPMSKNEQNGYADGFGSGSKAPMTVKQLKDTLKNGLTYDEFAGYKSELFSVSINKEYPKFNTVTALIALENGGFVYLTYKGESKEVIQARLFDSTLRFCGDLLTEGYTGLTPKGKLTFDEYTIKASASSELPAGIQSPIIIVKLKEPSERSPWELFPEIGIAEYVDVYMQKYEELNRDALAGNGVTWEEVKACKEKVGTEFIIVLKEDDEQYILYEIDLLKSNPLVESVSVSGGYEYKEY